jgi:carboxyl-terminal processing protease
LTMDKRETDMEKYIKRALGTVHIALFAAALVFSPVLFSSADVDEKASDFYREIKLFETIVQRIRINYVTEVDPTTLIHGAIRGMMNELDDHTMFFDSEDFRLLLEDTEGAFGGLGITISVTPEDNTLTVMSVLEGTPAERVGLESRDKIIEIDGESTEDITAREALTKLRGDVGTDVTIKVFRNGIPEPIEFTIARGSISVESVPYYFMVSDDVGYVRLTNFSRNEETDSTTELKDAITELRAQGMSKLILDLRGNPGGLLDEAVGVSNMFLDKNSLVVYTKGRSMKWEEREYFADERPVFPKGKMVVLVDGGSASASEIVAGALKDHGRAVIMGEKTFGKGSVQSIVPLTVGTDEEGDFPGMKITIAHYYTPDGNLIDGIGIEPDVALEQPDMPLVVTKLYSEGMFRIFAENYYDTYGEAAVTSFDSDPEVLDDFKAMTREREFQFYPEAYAETLPDGGYTFYAAAVDEEGDLVVRLLKREVIREMDGDGKAYEFWRQGDEWINRAVEELS